MKTAARIAAYVFASRHERFQSHKKTRRIKILRTIFLNSSLIWAGRGQSNSFQCGTHSSPPLLIRRHRSDLNIRSAIRLKHLLHEQEEILEKSHYYPLLCSLCNSFGITLFNPSEFWRSVLVVTKLYCHKKRYIERYSHPRRQNWFWQSRISVLRVTMRLKFPWTQTN